MTDDHLVCPICNGNGLIGGEVCRSCNGTGRIGKRFGFRRIAYLAKLVRMAP